MHGVAQFPSPAVGSLFLNVPLVVCCSFVSPPRRPRFPLSSVVDVHRARIPVVVVCCPPILVVCRSSFVSFLSFVDLVSSRVGAGTKLKPKMGYKQ